MNNKKGFVSYKVGPDFRPTIHILVGVSGSGKSTLAEGLPGAKCSADSFFVNADGVYEFDFMRLGEAHGSCFRAALEAAQRGESVVVDNTNTTIQEVSPYILLAQAFGADVRVSHVTCDIEIAAQRNRHGVPLETIRAQARRITELLEAWPPWWPKIETLSLERVPE